MRRPHPIEWLRDDCPDGLAWLIMVLGLVMVALSGVWIILACYLLRWVFGWHMGIEDAHSLSVVYLVGRS